MSFIDVRVGARLRRERLAIGRSLSDQAAAVGVGEARLAAFEDGTDRVPAAVLQRFCTTLGLKPSDIYAELFAPGEEPGAEVGLRL